MIEETKKIKKITSNLDFKNLENKHLSIQFSLDGFSFCVLNKNTNEFTDLFDYEFKYTSHKTPQTLLTNIAEVFKQNSLLTNKYNTVTISHINDLASFVPKSLFSEEKLSTYVEYNNKIFKSDYFAHDEIKNHKIINVFAPYVNVNNFFIDHYKSFEYKHISSVLVRNLLDIYKYSQVPHAFVNVHTNHFEVVVIKDKKLQLYNTFNYKTKEDFIYYILFVAEQLNLNTEKFELELFGCIEKNDELYNIAYKYIRNINLLENRSKYKFNDNFTEEDKRRYFTLLHQY